MTGARLAIGLEYDGGNYHGWQSQPGSPSVQNVVNQALSRVADHEVRCMGGGRTDAGVHAIEQVAHFDTSAERRTRDWLMGTNTYLPEDVNLLWVRQVDADFHSRYSATARSYAYLILNRSVRSALERNRAWLIRDPLDADAMDRAAQAAAGRTRLQLVPRRQLPGEITRAQNRKHSGPADRQARVDHLPRQQFPAAHGKKHGGFAGVGGPRTPASRGAGGNPGGPKARGGRARRAGAGPVPAPDRVPPNSALRAAGNARGGGHTAGGNDLAPPFRTGRALPRASRDRLMRQYQRFTALI